MFNVAAISAPRRTVDFASRSDGVERAADDPTLPADRVSLSPEARSQLTLAGAGGRVTEPGGAASPDLGRRDEPQPGTTAGRPAQASSLTQEQQHQVLELQQRDTHVRAHEAAHQSAGGDLTGPASFSYRLGPDGRSYAVGGEVSVQARAGRTPDETIAIARRVRAAALAPSDPSSADLAAAAAASQVELRALQQKREQGQAGSAVGPAAAAGASRLAPAPGSTSQANLERLIVRSPEPEPFM